MGNVPDLLLEFNVTVPPVDVTDGAVGAAVGGNEVAGGENRFLAVVTSLFPLSGSAVATLLKGGAPPPDLLKEPARLGAAAEL